MKLRWPAMRGLRRTSVVSARRPPFFGLWIGPLLMAGLGLGLPMATSDWLEESRVLERRSRELDASLLREQAKLRQMEAALNAAPAQAATARIRAGDRFELHGLALNRGLRVESLKSADGGSANHDLSLQLRGRYSHLTAFMLAMARSEVSWGLQDLQLTAGTDREHSLGLRLKALPLGPWMQAPPMEAVRLTGLLERSDPFAALPPLPGPPDAAPAAQSLSDLPAQWRDEFARERQALEAQPLRELFLTGTFRQGQSWVALLRSGAVVHILKVGDYLGPDFGRVQAVDQDGLDLRELKRDAQGQWGEQMRRWRVGAAP